VVERLDAHRAPKPTVELTKNGIVSTYVHRDLTADWVKTQLAQDMSRVVQVADYSATEVKQWNATLEGAIGAAVRNRGEKLRKGQAVADELDA
jgi:hypothetical protein